VQRGARRRRGTLGPQVVDQLVAGAELARVEEKRDETRPRPLASKRELTLGVERLERSEDAEGERLCA